MKSRKPLSTKGSSGFLLTGSIIAIIIAFSPYIFYLYEIFPNGPVWETSFFTYESKYYQDVLTAAWTYLGKITPLILLLIWFFTCKHWWYHVILVPIGMYSFQLVAVVYDDVYLHEQFFADTNQLVYLAPFFILILSLVYLIRIKVFDRIYGIDLTEIERENISPFSPFSDKEYEEIRSFREDTSNDGEIQEEYYVKL
ncbi:hypothetical protein JRG66_13760 [Salinimicrobium tongyeongense]|uniref:Uncharacterized protein n=1 Tax=Salinimicrobium tongyeongense TaxID=2809707 RepID=A0ABY6NQ47_9FLAO|nr:hypothetical protein [Salinimicrobium tongyeongense]UZH55009.1 hypothetical protein JRG66_13760 [Salinimicrobium tongyeongense]